MPFGMSENFDSNESTQVSKEQTTETTGAIGDGLDLDKGNTTETTKQPNEVLDLDKVERFRFAGKDWTPKELSDAYMLRNDYTRKTQELSEARKYAENFEADFEALRANPKLMQQFSELYPKYYVDLASKMLARLEGNPTQNSTQSTSTTNLPPELEKRLERAERYINDLESAKSQAAAAEADAWLDKTYAKLAKKYPNADDVRVTVAAELAYHRKEKIDEALLERFFKQSHEEMSGKLDTYYKSKVTEQTKANEKAKDIGPGGGIPGQAPVKHKSIGAARQAWLEDIKSAQ